MNVLAQTSELNREEWMELRGQGIGGSEASVIMGVNPYRSLMDLWLEKVGEFSEDEDNEAMYWGRVLEDVVAREFTERTRKKVRRRNAILRDQERPWMLANVDRLVVGEKAGLECKTTNAFYRDEGEVPSMYYAQVQHYMAVTGYSLWYVAVLAGGQRFYLYEVPRNEDYIEELTQRGKTFWDLVQGRTPPEFDGSEASSRVLNRMYPWAEKEEKKLPHDAFALVQQYEEAAEEEKAAKGRKDEAINRLKGMMGVAERGFVYDRKVHWTNVVSKKFDTKTFQRDHEDLYNQYVQESSYRRFQIK